MLVLINCSQLLHFFKLVPHLSAKSNKTTDNQYNVVFKILLKNQNLHIGNT